MELPAGPSSNNIAELQEEVFINETKALWVFAYGSLCWKPGFQFNKAVTGYVQGFQRRFWQGNTTHRGTEEKPGRVATLVEHEEGAVHGVAFAISGETALMYLSRRECDLGGYNSKIITFYPMNGEPFKVLVYVATPNNSLWLGEADVKDIAHQVIQCNGPSGHNVEYVIRLADFMKNHFPEHDDNHLYDLEREVLRLINNKNLNLLALMGNGDGIVTFVKRPPSPNAQNQEEEEQRTDSFEHAMRLPQKNLRCLNI